MKPKRRHRAAKPKRHTFLNAINKVMNQEILDGVHDAALCERLPSEMPAGSRVDELPSYAVTAMSMMSEQLGMPGLVRMVLSASSDDFEAGIDRMKASLVPRAARSTPEPHADSFCWRCVVAMAGIIWDTFLMNELCEKTNEVCLLIRSRAKAKRLMHDYIRQNVCSASMLIPVSSYNMWNNPVEREQMFSALDIALRHIDSQCFNHAAWLAHEIRSEHEVEPCWNLVKSVTMYVPSQCALCFETTPGFECSTPQCAALTCSKCIASVHNVCPFCTIGNFDM
jgi:hypothetical protein